MGTSRWNGEKGGEDPILGGDASGVRCLDEPGLGAVAVDRLERGEVR